MAVFPEKVAISHGGALHYWEILSIGSLEYGFIASPFDLAMLVLFAKKQTPVVYLLADMTNKTGSGRKRINQRLMSAPANAVLTSAWLKHQGISSRLADYYARSGWLHRVGDGAFAVQSNAPTWLGAVFGLQQRSKSFHPGGRTALELAGLAHFVPLGEAYPLYLFSRTGERLPAWFKRLPWSNRVCHVTWIRRQTRSGIGIRSLENRVFLNCDGTRELLTFG